MTTRGRLVLALLVAASGCESVFGVGYSGPADAAISSTWTAVGAGRAHTCGIRGDGTLWCWGANGRGQVGAAFEQAEVITPVQIGTGRWTGGAAGSDHTCAIAEDRVLWCWGANDDGQVGASAPGDVPPVPVLANATELTAGQLFTCAIVDGGQLRCWGKNHFQQVGVYTTYAPQRTPVDVHPGTAYALVRAGEAHACGITTAGALQCWGSSEVGNRNAMNPDGLNDAMNAEPFVIEPGRTFTKLAIGDRHTCALRDDGVLRCWGSNGFSQLATSPAAYYAGPLDVPTTAQGTRWVDVFAGALRTCARRDDDTLWCWGRNAQSELAYPGPDETQPRPVQIGDASSRWKTASLGEKHLCAIDASDRLLCAGNGARGQRGDGTGGGARVPRVVDGTWLDVSVGTRHGCARAPGVMSTADTIACWGYNQEGQVGDGSSRSRQRPVPVTTVDAGRPFGAGEAHSCAAQDARLLCWGNNAQGQLHIAPPPTSIPTPTPTGSATRDRGKVLALGHNTCFVNEPVAGSAGACWGPNNRGQLGAAQPDPTPYGAEYGTNVITFAVGLGHICRMFGDKIVRCYGANSDGQLGATTPGDDVGGTYRDVRAGDHHTCAITTEGTLACWGRNASGQLGTGDVTNQMRPRAVVGGATWLTVAPGGEHTCGIQGANGATAGTLWCWGSGRRGQLGLGSTERVLVPAQVGTDADWIAVDTGGDTSCAVKQGGALYCWGDNEQGQVGDGSAWSPDLVPVR